MQRILFGLCVSLAAAAPARAQVIVQTPWTSIRVGPPSPTRILVQTPWATIAVPVSPAAGRQVPAPPLSDTAYIPGAPPPVPLPIPVEPETRRAATLSEFAATFQPKAGRYEVDIEHPLTGRPVHVSFSLPDGNPKRVKVHRRELEFDYSGKTVSIHFLRGGEVRVRD